MSLGPIRQESKALLDRLHTVLMRLHKELLERQRAEYEREIAPIENPMEFFRLAQDHESFAWLRPILQLIVTIDESTDARGGATEDAAQASIAIARSMFVDGGGDAALLQRIDYAARESPQIDQLRGELMQLLSGAP
jgi:hypothetical protein